MAVELITVAEYARRRGCDEKAVRKALAEGRITAVERDGRRLIDPEVADIQWARNTRARADSRPAAGAVTPPPADSLPVTGPVASYEDARRRRELAEANLAELKLAELQGVLVRADDVRASLARRAAAFREGMLQIPARLAAVLAAETDQAKVHVVLDTELRQVLALLTEA